MQKIISHHLDNANKSATYLTAKLAVISLTRSVSGFSCSLCKLLFFLDLDAVCVRTRSPCELHTGGVSILVLFGCSMWTTTACRYFFALLLPEGFGFEEDISCISSLPSKRRLLTIAVSRDGVGVVVVAAVVAVGNP